MNNLSVIFLSTLPDIGIKSLGTKSLIKIKNRYLLDYQLEAINKACRNKIKYEILIASAFDYSKTYKVLQNYDVRIIKQDYENINFGGAALHALHHARFDNILLINYGCLFSADIITHVIGDMGENRIGIINDPHSILPVSCLIQSGHIENMFFDITNDKFSEICFINRDTKQYMCNSLNLDNYINKFMFEIINKSISDNQTYRPIILNHKHFMFLNSYKHITSSKGFIKRHEPNYSKKTQR